MTEIITRQQAIEKGLKHYYTGIPCSNGHLSKRNVKNSMCCYCNNTTEGKKDRGTRHRTIPQGFFGYAEGL
jgi:hypothetical protein